MRLFSPIMRQACTFTMFSLFSSAAPADIALNGTRVIYLSDAKDVSLQVDNVGASSVLLQNWIDDGNPDAKPATIKVPFMLSPLVSRVDPGKGQRLRLIYTGNNLPIDRESLFWLNVMEIPVKDNSNRVRLVLRTRIKLLYRPAGLQGNASDAVKVLTWSTQDRNLQANNPTPYYVSFAYLSVNGKKLAGAMIAPHATQVFTLPGHAGSKVSGSFVNDYGAIAPFEAIVE